MELIVRPLVGAFDPIGSIIPALVCFAVFRKQKLGWLYSGIVVAIVRVVLGLALGVITPVPVMAIAGFVAGVLWFVVAKGVGALKNKLS